MEPSQGSLNLREGDRTSSRRNSPAREKVKRLKDDPVRKLGLEKVAVIEQPLEIPTGSGRSFLEHPLLRGGFLDDIYECFQDQDKANEFMKDLSQKTSTFTPLFALRCAISGWSPEFS